MAHTLALDPVDAYIAGILDYTHARRIADRERKEQHLDAEAETAVFLRELEHRRQLRVDSGQLPPMYSELAKAS